MHKDIYKLRFSRFDRQTDLGGLLAYNQVWVSGAHTATKVTFLRDVIVNNKVVSKGTYLFSIIPEKESRTIILNQNYKQHLTNDYKE